MKINTQYAIIFFSFGIFLVIADVQACKVLPEHYFVKNIELNILYIKECNSEECLKKKKQLDKRADIEKPYCLGYAQIERREEVIIVSGLECKNVPIKFIGLTWKDNCHQSNLFKVKKIITSKNNG